MLLAWSYVSIDLCWATFVLLVPPALAVLLARGDPGRGCSRQHPDNSNPYDKAAQPKDKLSTMSQQHL